MPDHKMIVLGKSVDEDGNARKVGVPLAEWQTCRVDISAWLVCGVSVGDGVLVAGVSGICVKTPSEAGWQAASSRAKTKRSRAGLMAISFLVQINGTRMVLLYDI